MKRILILTACAAALLLAGCSSAARRLLADDPLVRSEAIEEAARSDDRSKHKIVARMKKVLAGKATGKRAYAAAALEDLGPAAAGAIPEMISALDDRDPGVAASAERALKHLETAAPALAAALDTKDARLRARIASVLAAQGAPAAAALARNFEKGNKALALESAALLGRLGPAAEKAVPTLARAAAGRDEEVRTAASSALTAIGSPAGLWLAGALRSASPSSRAGASRVLSEMVPPPAEAAEALAAALEDPDEKVRGNAARALAAYPPETLALSRESFISALFRAARSPDESASVWASITLVRMGAPAGKWLAGALKAADPAARAGAALVISRMFPPPAEAAGAALAALKDSDPAVRLAAAGALGVYAMTAPSALPKTAALELAAALKGGDAALRSALIFSLGRLAPKNRRAAAALVGALEDGDLEVKKSAASAVRALGPAARKALPALRENLKSRDCSLRSLSAAALLAIDPAFKKNSAVARAAGTACPGVKTMPRIEAVLATAETVLGSTTTLSLPFAEELMRYSTGQAPAAP